MILYSTGCPLCRSLEQKMNRAGVSYTKIDDEDEMIRLGFQSVPMLMDGKGNYLNFSDAMKLMDSIIKENANEDQHQAG